MYIDHFGLREAPFSITPDPHYLYMSERHREAFAHLLYGLNDGGGFVQLTGEVGTGKTTLCRCLLEQLPENVDVAFILNPRLSDVELLASICDELHIECAGPGPNPTWEIAVPGAYSLKSLVDALHRYLLDAHARGRRTVLLIDEAQNLSIQVLEQIRLLTNLETTTQKLLQVILIGQPELILLLDRPELRQLAQRITARCHLSPCSRLETRGYILHRLAVAGSRERLFSDRALDEIYRYSRGLPRLINVLCDRALLGAYVEDQSMVDARTVRKAIREISGYRPRHGARYWPMRWAVAAAVVIGGSWAWFEIARTPALRAGLRKHIAAVIAWTPLQTVTAAVPPTAPSRVSDGVVSTSQRPLRVLSPLPPLDAPMADVLPTPPVGVTVNRASAQAEPDKTKTAAAGLAAFLHDANVHTDRKTALTTLFALWKEEGGASCEKPSPSGVECLSLTGNWSAVRDLDLPAMLPLTTAAGVAHYVVLAALHGTDATLNVDGRTITVPLTEIEPLWFGRYTALWRPPSLQQRVLRAGMVGSDVLWLRSQLSGVPLTALASTADQVFDAALRARVTEFQRSHALAVDGVVGRETLLYLSVAADPQNMPRLSSQSP